MSVRSDAELARAWQAGDRTAFAEVYEKYSPSLFGVAMGLVRDRAAAADVVHDAFVRAARRIDALREPDRLRAWLFAILRNEATDLLRGRSRESVEDVSAMSDQLAADLPEPHTELSRSELADVVWAAAGALQQRDREVLELHLRAGLEAGDLADALGVTPGHAAVLLSRMRDRMEKAIGALLVARLGRRECTTLDGLLADWDGRFTLDVRSRVTRHTESCPVCGRGRTQLASYARLAPAILPVFVVPELLRDKVLGSLQLVSQELAAGGGGGGTPTGDGLDNWTWREDGFPHPRQGRPAAGGEDDAAAGGAAGGAALAAAAGAGALAAGLGGHPPQPVADPWTLPAEQLPTELLPSAGLPGPGEAPVAAPNLLPPVQPWPPTPPPPGSGTGPVPPPRGRVRTGLLVAGAAVLLLVGGIGTWKVVADPGGNAGDQPSGTGTVRAIGDAATTAPSDPFTGTTPATTTSGPVTTSPSSSATTTGPTTATTSGTATASAPVSPGAPHLAVSASGLTFGRGTSSTSTTRTVTLTDDGGQPLTWTAATSGAGFSVSSGSGSLAPAGTATLSVVLDRANVAEGAVSGSLVVHAAPSGQSFTISLSGTVANPPVVTVDSFSSPLAVGGAPTTCRSTTGGLRVSATDDSGPKGVASVVVSWPGGSSRLSQDGAPWYGSYGPFAAVDDYTLTVSARDVHGNVGTASFRVSVQKC